MSEVRTVRLMNCGIRVIGLKRGQDAQSRSRAKKYFRCNLVFTFALYRTIQAGNGERWRLSVLQFPTMPAPADAITTIADLKKRVLAFARERDWEQFHSPKNLSMALAAEAGELMEHFLWADSASSQDRCRETARRLKIEEEIADVVIYSLEFANVTGIDLAAAIESKLAANAQKYPVEKARGRSEKYTEL